MRCPPDGTRAVAVCETEYDKHDWAVRRFKARYDTTVQDPDKTDAKHVVNKLLADDGVASQFLASKPPEQSGDGPLVSAEDLAAAVKDDHAGHAAIADLLRNAGLVHARLGDALAHGRQGISAPHAYVGLHIREQKKNGRRLSITLVALIPDGRPVGRMGIRVESASRHAQDGVDALRGRRLRSPRERPDQGKPPHHVGRGASQT
jgi:hypothetical protein